MRIHLTGILTALLALVMGMGCEAQRSRTADVNENHTVSVGPNRTIASQFTSLPVVEPQISAHPGNDEHLLVAAMVVTDIERPYESCRLVSFVSLDGGTSWKETVHDWWGYDPWTAIGSDGTTVMSWIGTSGSFQDKYPVQLFFSKDGGTSWLPDIQTLPGMHDGTKLAVHKKDFYFTTVRFRESDGADVVLFSRSGNNPFLERGYADSKGARLNFCEPAITSEGNVIVPAMRHQEESWAHIVDPRSGTWSGKKTVTREARGLSGYARLVSAQNTNSLYLRHVYFVRAQGASGLFINRSTNDGESWEPDLRIDLFSSSDSHAASVPSAAVNSSGVLGVSWVDLSAQGGKKAYDVYFTASSDGGVTFTRPTKLTAVSSDPRTSKNGDVANKFTAGGHYLGLATRADGSFQAVWSDSRYGHFQLQTCTIIVR